MGAAWMPPDPRAPQGAALECSFSPEETFEAVWVNESAVRCNQVVVSDGEPRPPTEGRGPPPCLLCSGTHRTSGRSPSARLPVPRREQETRGKGRLGGQGRPSLRPGCAQQTDGGLGLRLQTLASAPAAAHGLGQGEAEVRGPTPPPQEQSQPRETRPE